jgi:hypothetical protein
LEGIFKKSFHNHGAFEAGRHWNTCICWTYSHFYRHGNLHSNPTNSHPDRIDTNSNPDRCDTNSYSNWDATNSYSY